MRTHLTIIATLALCVAESIALDVRGQGCSGTTYVTDIDGNVYPVVTIGTQCWMGKDLITTHYRDGSNIPDGLDMLLTTGAAMSYMGIQQNDYLYGRLYNWYAVANPNICPLGWHMPTDAEWTTLEITLGGPLLAGGKLKETGTVEGGTGLWYAPNSGATNESGFAARPGGCFCSVFNDHFDGLGYNGNWWSASASDATDAWYRTIDFTAADLLRNHHAKWSGSCVRCVLGEGIGNGIAEREKAGFTVAPNPTNSAVTIAFAPNGKPQSVSLLDATGRIISEQRITATGPITLDLSGHDNGLYFVLIAFADGSRTIERVVKQ